MVAHETELPEDAEYWTPGGFDTESAARDGRENGVGAVQEGNSYVKIETAGEHNYFYLPHEAAGMAGTVIVEK